MREKKFYVIISQGTTEYDGFHMDYYTYPYSNFTHALITGSGYNCDSGKRLKTAKADMNKDNKLTLNECYEYIRKMTGKAAACYPQNSNFTLFERKK